MGKCRLHVLRGVSFQVNQGEFVAVVGASGSGKSTLLHIVGLLDKVDRGSITLDGIDAATLSAGKRNRIRCEDTGFVFQFYHLMRELNILENVMLPAMVDSPTLSWLGQKKNVRPLAEELLEKLGLSDRLRHKPSELSGGERQRVAIVRALINRPKVLLADEPTGNLDSKTGEQIMGVLKEFHKDMGQTLLMVTHDSTIAEQADRILHLRDGRLTD